MYIPSLTSIFSQTQALIVRISRTAICCVAVLTIGTIALPTPILAAAAADDARARIRGVLMSSRPLGYVMPENADMRSYPDQTVHELDKLLKGQTDDCLRSVEIAVFLDAHLHESSLEEGLSEIYETGLTEEILNIWVVPDIYAGSDSALKLLGNTTLAASVEGLGIASNLFSTYDALVDHNVRAAAARHEAWVQEIVHQSIQGSWDENQIVRAQGLMQEKIQRQMARAAEINQIAERAVNAAEIASSDAILKLKIAYENEMDAARVKAKNSAVYLEDKTYKNDVNRAELKLTNGKKAALDKRQADILASLALREREMSDALQRIAKAKVQQDSVSRYSVPIARQQCESIRKKGIAPKAVHCDKGDVLCLLTRLPHDRLLSTLKELSVEPSQDFLNCLCRSAGYGSPSASQFYEADTIGKYDVRYSCQQPGDPCIVAGYGCTRHPLPRKTEIWTGCGAKGQSDTSKNPVEDFLSALRKRATVAKTK